MTKDEQIAGLQKIVKRLKANSRRKLETSLIKTLQIDPAKEYVLVLQRDCGLYPEEAAEIRIPNIKFIVVVDNINQIKTEEKETFKKEIYEKEIHKT